MLDDAQEAEDLTQDIFLKAFRSLPKFRMEAKISTWLYRIAVSSCLNHRRQKKFKRLLSLDFLMERAGDAVGPQSPVADDPMRELENKEAASALRKAMASLPERQLAALVLQHDEGLTLEEIADVLRTSTSAVESLLHRAKRSLQKRLLPVLREM
jgi:RNA polymerase sigma-70 factor (ECF subfamily)